MEKTNREDEMLRKLSNAIDKVVVKYYGLPNEECEMTYAAYTLSKEFKRIFLNEEAK